MAIKSFTRSTIENNIFYRSMLAGNAFYNPSDEDILAEEVLTSSQASVTFSSLDTLAAGYQHLQVRMTNRQDRAVTGFDRVAIRFNGDTGTNYAGHYVYGNGSSVSSVAWAASKSYALGGITIFNGDTSGAFGANVIDILDPFETTKYTTTRTLGGAEAAGQKWIGLHSGLWMNTAAVTSITIFGESSTYDCLTGSRFTLIGLK